MPEFVLSPNILVVPILIVLIVLEFGLSRLMGRSVYSFQDSITSINIGIMSQFVNATGAVISAFMYAVIEMKYGTFEWNLASPVTWIFALLLYDFMYYWVHRTGHEVNMFWAAHITHHSSDEFNFSTALRQASTGFYFKWVFYMPLAVLGIPVQVFVVVGLIDLLYQVWVHTRLVGRLGWVEYVLVTPSNHRVHHGKNDYCIDKNYGGIFCTWDMLFGTYADERVEEPIVYGLKKKLHSWNPVWSNLHYWSEMFKKAGEQDNWRNKLMCFFAEPAWSADGNSAPKPLAQFPATDDFFASRTPLRVKLSGLAMTLFSVGLLVFYLGSKQSMSAGLQIFCATAAVCSFAFVGYFWTQGNKKELQR